MSVRFLAMAAALLICVSPLMAVDSEKSWQPPPPMPDDFDWVQMNSGEWLKGEIIVMYNETMEFDSDEFDVVKLDWSDIRQLRSAGTVVVGMLDRTVATGRVFLDGDTIRVMGDEDRSFAKAEVLAITAGEPREINFWNFKLSLGANIRSGNTDQTETTTTARIQRRTVRSRIAVDFLGNYSITDDVTASDNQRLSGAWDLFLSDRLFVTPVFAEWYRDPFQNIATKYTVGVGLGYQIMDTPKIEWQVSGGPAYQHTEFDDVIEGEAESDDAPALVIGTTYDHELSKMIDFLFDYRVTFTNETSGTYLHHLVTGLEFELTRLLDFDVTWVWERIRDPRQNSDGGFPKQDDYRLSFALGFDF